MGKIRKLNIPSGNKYYRVATLNANNELSNVIIKVKNQGEIKEILDRKWLQ